MTENNETTLLEGPVGSILVKADECADIHLWKDEKRKDFVGLFVQRVDAAMYILRLTACEIAHTAKDRLFIGEIPIKVDAVSDYDHRVGYRTWKNPGSIGGRTLDELGTIASERAEAIINELPPIKKALEILDKDILDKMTRKENILAKLKSLRTKIEEYSQPICMADLDQKMTIGEFRKLVKDTTKERQRLFREMDELAEEGNGLNYEIHKKLYKGIPGLREAIESVINQHIDRATALGETSRRMEEQILYGDSDAALEILKAFEKDEVAVPDNIKAEFSKALESLKVYKKKLGKGKK